MVTTSASSRAGHPRRRARRGEGDRLREEILQAAKELLAEAGDEDAVSVRAVADRVGVSTPSLYLHFPDKAALIEAVCADVFAELDMLMEQAAQGEPDPFEGLRLRGLAYARFALANPEHYRIVMMTPRRGFTGDDSLSSATYAHLVAAVERCRDIGIFTSDQDVDSIAFGLWAAAHGVVSLVLAKPDLRHEDALAMCDAALSAAGLGMALAGRLPGQGALDTCPTSADLVRLLDDVVARQASPNGT